MPIRFPHRCGFLLAGTLATALAAWPSAAQQSTPTPPPPTPNQPSSDAATRLRGITPPPFATAADKLPIPQLKLPKGFKIEVFMSGVPNARSLRLGDKGTVFVSNRILDKVYAVVEKGGKRELHILASGLDRPNGLAFRNGALYIAEGTKVSKLENVEDNIDNPPKPVVIYDRFPNHQSHGWKYMAVGPDNKLYINVGAPCNICLPPETNAQIVRIESRRQRRRAVCARRAQLRRVRFPSGNEGALFHRQRARLVIGGAAARRTQPRHQGRATFRLPVLPPGRSARRPVRLGAQVQ